jgi:hypothetical protein
VAGYYGIWVVDIVVLLLIECMVNMIDEKSRTIVGLMNVNNDISGRTIVGLTQWNSLDRSEILE